MDPKSSVKDEKVKSEAILKSAGSFKSYVKAASRASSKCTSSSKCSVPEAAARARASAEAAHTKMAYAKNRLEIKNERARLDLEKATLDADLEALEVEREAEAARVKAEVAMKFEDAQSVRSTVLPSVVQQRTEEYVQHQTQLNTQASASSLHNEILHCVKNLTLQTSLVDADKKPTNAIFTSTVNEHTGN